MENCHSYSVESPQTASCINSEQQPSVLEICIITEWWWRHRSFQNVALLLQVDTTFHPRI